MRSDLLKAIAASKEVTNAIILTHNIDFVFLQTVALASLRKCGYPAITVFADAQCAAESFEHQAPLLDGLGVRYRVVPVAMSPGFRFHPKAVLLSGENEGTLFIGSGNLTYGGWKENAEFWLRFDASVDGPAIFGEFEEYLQKILERVPLSDVIEEELTETFDSTTRRWLRKEGLSTSATLLGRVGRGPSLLESFQSMKGYELIDELVVCSPYFDAEGVALRALIEKIDASRTTVLCQPSGSTLTRKAFDGTAGTANLQQVSFEHISADGAARSAFIHAKFYGLLRHNEALAIVGSANCSRAALVASGNAGNAELLALCRMPVAEFESLLVGELQRVPAPAVLAEIAPDSEEESTTPLLRVLAARFETGILLTGFAPTSAPIRSCEVDGASVRFSLVEPGVIRVVCSVEPRWIRLEGLFDSASTWSASTWIDHERHLRVSARGRGFADSIRARMQPGGWNATAWMDVVDVFCKHLTYIPMRGSGRADSTTSGIKATDLSIFSFTDVFSSSYRAPVASGLGRLLTKIDGSHERSLQQLLLRWFGVAHEGEELTGIAAASGDGLDDEVDRPEVLATPSRTRLPSHTLAEADKRRIQRVLQQVEVAMTKEQFLAERRPELLAADLKVAAVLLRSGLREGWLGSDEFLKITHRVWISLFLSGSPVDGQGWLEYRLHHAVDSTAFVTALRSPELAAALLGWAFAVMPDRKAPTSVRFRISAALAVARLPWIWDGGDETAVAQELGILLAHTGPHVTSTVESVGSDWERMLRVGHALLRLESAAKTVPPEELRERIGVRELLAGDLIWQGAAGYAVVTTRILRTEGAKVPVLKLGSDLQEVQFLAEYTMPVRSLLDAAVLPRTQNFDTQHRHVMSEFLDDLSNLAQLE